MKTIDMGTHRVVGIELDRSEMDRALEFFLRFAYRIPDKGVRWTRTSWHCDGALIEFTFAENASLEVREDALGGVHKAQSFMRFSPKAMHHDIERMCSVAAVVDKDDGLISSSIRLVDALCAKYGGEPRGERAADLRSRLIGDDMSAVVEVIEMATAAISNEGGE